MYFQFDVSAIDGGGRRSTVNAQVVITIIRNNYDPVFSASSCSASLDPGTNTGTPVVTVSASDSDPDVLGNTNMPVSFFLLPHLTA